MSQPYLGEIRMFAGNFPPNGWLFCDGQIISISENDALFTLIGTTYGGDGQETFALPNLTGRVPVHMGAADGGTHQGLGTSAGTETVTLTAQTLPAHTHTMSASLDQASAAVGPANGVPGSTGASQVYGLIGTPAAMKADTITTVGGSQPHENMAPYLAVNFIISVSGTIPSET